MPQGLHVCDLVVQPAAGVRVGPISFTLAPGEVLLLQGPNGSGKTTLLKALAGLTPVESGQITRPAGSAWVAQQPEHEGDVPLGVDEVLALNEQRTGTVAERKLRRARALEAVLLPQREHRRLATLSGGEQQRVRLAAALLSAAPLLLLDEATSAVDVTSDAMLARHMAQHLIATGRMAVIVTHRPEAWSGLTMRSMHLPARTLEAGA